MDPSIPVNEQAYETLLKAQENQAPEDLDFEAVIRPALKFLQDQNRQIPPGLLSYAIKHTPPSALKPEEQGAYILFFKQQNLSSEEVAGLVCNLLSYQKNELARLILKAYEGRFKPDDAAFLSQLAVNTNNKELIDEILRRNGTIPPEAMRTALQCKNDAMIEYLVEKGCKIDIFKIEPFFNSVHSTEVFLRKIDTWSDKERRDFLSEALKAGAIFVVDALLNLHPELLKTPNKKNQTPLEEVAHLLGSSNFSRETMTNIAVTAGCLLARCYNTPLIQNIAEKDVNIIIESCLPQKSFFNDLLTPEHAKLLTEIVTEYELRKLVGHACSLPSTKDFVYEGTNSDTDLITINERALARGLASVKETEGLSKDEQEAIIEALSNADLLYRSHNVEAAAQKIQNGELVIVPTGFLQHHMSVVFYKGYMVICNRGPKKNAFHTMEAFKIDPTKMTPETVEEMTNTVTKTGFFSRPRERDYRAGPFFSDIAKRLSPTGSALQDDFCHAVSKISPRGQSVGNCGFTSPKTAIRAALALLRTDPADPTTWGNLEKARKDSKVISTVLRLRFLEDYLEHQAQSKSVKTDHHLLSQATQKIFRHLVFKWLPKDKILSGYPKVKALLDYQQKLSREIDKLS